uniref:Uncharacterized protein n=1 Tax=Ananas comosus var. bracteatus TaxID=296719 RepID=A0A6V7PT47_ANACO|nr:unnamed protein product [Ananas comosus var. bracteatus]
METCMYIHVPPQRLHQIKGERRIRISEKKQEKKQEKKKREEGKTITKYEFEIRRFESVSDDLHPGRHRVLQTSRPDAHRLRRGRREARRGPVVAPRNAVLPPKRQAFKLYERRSGLKNLKTISPLAPASRNSASGFSPRRRQQQPEILSPSVLDFPALALSPVTPLNPDPFNRSPQPNSAAAVADEERAIAEKGFYLHPSPRSAEPPRLLPLFPVTSPRACPASAAATATGSFP